MSLPPGKQALLDHEAQVRATALSGYQPPPNPNYTPPPGPPPVPWGTGVVDIPQAPFSADEYRVVKQWQDVVGGTQASVYAGAYEHDQAQGILLVPLTSLDDAHASSYAYKGTVQNWSAANRVSRRPAVTTEVGGRLVV